MRLKIWLLIRGENMKKKKNRVFPPMPEKEYSDLVDLCMIQSSSANEKRMVVYIVDKLTKMGFIYNPNPHSKKTPTKNSFYIDSIGNIIVTKGTTKTYPCIVSHMDTVHDVEDNYKIFYYSKDENDKKLFAKNGKLKGGIGGDDKCGVYACLYMLKNRPSIKAVFFTQEETGCKGSNNIDKTFFDDVRYIIQLDRYGNSDFIDKYMGQKTVSQEFSSEIGKLKKEFGFKSAVGIYTDAINLWDDNVGISCVNISCGFYAPHSVNEYIIINELWNSVLFTEKIIKILKAKKYESIPSFVKTTYLTTKKSKEFEICIFCRKLKNVDYGFTNWKGKGFACFKCCNLPDNKNANKNTTHNHNLSDTLLSICRCNICNKEFKFDWKCRYEYGDFLEKYNYKWVCNTCINNDKEKSDVRYICPICKEKTNKRNLLVWSQLHKKMVCSKCHYDKKLRTNNKDTKLKTCSFIGCENTQEEKLGQYLTSAKNSWLCSSCNARLNKRKIDYDTKGQRCDFCSQILGDVMELTEIELAAARVPTIGIINKGKKYKICTNCLIGTKTKEHWTDKILEARTCDICYAVVNKEQGKEGILNVGFVCNRCIQVYSNELENV